MKNTRGSIILETSLVLPLFIFAVLFIFGLFRITLAENIVMHALIQSCKSLSMDTYITEHVESVAETESKVVWNSLSQLVLDCKRTKNSKYYSSITDWYAYDKDAKKAVKLKEAHSAVMNRFVGYLAGGSPSEADEILKSLGVEDLNFKVAVDDNNLTVTVEYNIQFWFDMFSAGRIKKNESIMVRLWK